jgi:hypothetical protein
VALDCGMKRINLKMFTSPPTLQSRRRLRVALPPFLRGEAAGKGKERDGGVCRGWGGCGEQNIVRRSKSYGLLDTAVLTKRMISFRNFPRTVLLPASMIPFAIRCPSTVSPSLFRWPPFRERARS